MKYSVTLRRPSSRTSTRQLLTTLAAASMTGYFTTPRSRALRTIRPWYIESETKSSDGSGFGHPAETGIGDRNFGYALRRDQWNHGYMTEALVAMLRFCFTDTGAGSVFATCRPANPASGRVMEKGGMRYVGTFLSRTDEGVIERRYIALRDTWLAERPPTDNAPEPTGRHASSTNGKP